MILKHKILLLACLMVLITQIGISLYLPSFASIAKNYSFDISWVGISLTTYMFGYALGMIPFGILADRVGKYNVLIALCIIFSCASLLIVFSTNFYWVLILRFIQGVAGGSCAILGRAIIRDEYSGKTLVSMMSLVTICFVLSGGIFQCIGGFIETYPLSWKSDFLLMAMLGMVCVAFIRSCRGSSIGKKKNIDAGKISDTFFCLVKDKFFVEGTIVGAFGYAMVVMFSTYSPTLFLNIYHVSAKNFGYFGLFLSAATILGMWLTSGFVNNFSLVKILRISFALVVISCGLMLVGLWLGKLLLITLGFLAIIVFQSPLYPIGLAIALTNFKNSSGFAMSLFGFSQQILGACLSLAAVLMKSNFLVIFIAILLFFSILRFNLLIKLLETHKPEGFL